MFFSFLFIFLLHVVLINILTECQNAPKQVFSPKQYNFNDFFGYNSKNHEVKKMKGKKNPRIVSSDHFEEI